jgi:predicted ATPase
MSIHSISIKNYKSIRDGNDIRFGNVNILIGANGAGKSNLISFFKLLNNIMNRNLQVSVKTTGRANGYLYFGSKKSPFLEGEIVFINDGKISNKYNFKLIPTTDGGFVFEKEQCSFNWGDNDSLSWGLPKEFTKRGEFESHIPDSNDHQPGYLKKYFRSLRIFHFHDTSPTALVKGYGNVNDSEFLREDARNLSAFLYKLSQNYPKHFKLIEKTIQAVAPFFNGFNLTPTSGNQAEINLTWLEKGSDDYFDANHLSDGTLRFICLTTLLLQPNPPETIIIDEPELGLHPLAIDKLAALIQSAASKTQIIVSTQSTNLLNNFEADNIIVVERNDNQSTFKQLNSGLLEEWLEEYSIGDLWNKNIIGGRP